MKKRISLLIAAFLTLSSVYGCAEQKKDYVSIDENSFITEYSETVEDIYSETKNDGLELYEKLFSLDNKVSVNIFMSKEEIGKLQEDFISARITVKLYSLYMITTEPWALPVD